MSAKNQDERIYNNYHSALKVARRTLAVSAEEQNPDACFEDCCIGYWEKTSTVHEEVRQMALKLTAERYHVTESEVSQIVRKLRKPDDKPKNRMKVIEKKRVHKRK